MAIFAYQRSGSSALWGPYVAGTAALRLGTLLVAELEVCIDDAGTTATVLVCDGDGFTTTPTDDPADTFCEPGLTAGTFTREMFSGGRVTGAVRAGFGSITIDNTDGRLDGWHAYAVDGRTITLRLGDDGAAYPGEYTTIAIATMERLELSLNEVTIILRDRLQDLDTPMCAGRYGGGGDLDGTTAMAGQRIPVGYGDVFNASPVLVDPSRLIYQMGPSYESSTLDQSVRDGGAVLTNGTNYSTEADLLATAPSSGQVRHYPAGGMFRLGSSSVFEITADRKFHDTATKVASKLIERMALDAGIASTDIDTVASMGLSSGLYARGDDTTWLQAMVRIANGSGLWFGFSRLGRLQVGRLIDPLLGSPVATIDGDVIVGLQRRAPQGMETPVRAVRLNWARNWHSLTTLAGSVSATDADRLRKEWLTAEASDDSILVRHPRAGTLEIDSYGLNLASMSEPSAEAQRQLQLHGTDRVLYIAQCAMTADTVAIDLGDVVTLELDRFDLADGKPFAVISTAFNRSDNTITLGLWG